MPGVMSCCAKELPRSSFGLALRTQRTTPLSFFCKLPFSGGSLVGGPLEQILKFAVE